MTTDYLLQDVITALNGYRGFAVRRTLEDQYGQYAVLARHTDIGGLVCAAKQTMHNDQVSIMQRGIEAAERGGGYVVVFVGQPSLGNAYVFDPAMIRANGSETEITSKKGVPVPACDIDPSHGAVLGDVVAGRDSVPINQAARQTRL